MLELFACHLFNVNKEQVLPHPQPLFPSLPPSQIFINKPVMGKRGSGGWRPSGPRKWRNCGFWGAGPIVVWVEPGGKVVEMVASSEKSLS